MPEEEILPEAAAEEIVADAAAGEPAPVKRGRKPKAVEAVAVEEAPQEAFPVKLLRNYRPMGRYKVTDENGENPINPPPTILDREAAGTFLLLPVEEARGVIKAGIAERNDPIG